MEVIMRIRKRVDQFSSNEEILRF